MAKEKLKLSDLKLESFVSTLQKEELDAVNGGRITIKGRQYSYRVRWTTVDTRTNGDHPTESTKHNAI